MAKAKATGSEEPATRGPNKKRAPFQLPPDVIERMRNAVASTDGETMAGLGERAIRREIDRLERERGAPFPARSGELKTGRPFGS